MMTIEAFNTIKNRRKHLTVRKNSEIKIQIKQVKREIILLKFQSKVNSINRVQLQKELAELMLRCGSSNQNCKSSNSTGSYSINKKKNGIHDKTTAKPQHKV